MVNIYVDKLLIDSNYILYFDELKTKINTSLHLIIFV